MKTSRPPHRDSDSTPRGDILATLEKLSLEDKLRRQRRAANQQLVQQSRGTLSQYQLNYQPMDKGVRKSLWEEGYRHRNDRKQLGFKHTKLEWRTPGMEDG